MKIEKARLDQPEISYVYSILRNGKCVYIGKGTGSRVFGSLKKQNGDEYIELVSGLSMKKARELEASFIKQIGLENLQNKYY